MAKLILGITGEMGSGKGTIAKHASLEHKASTRRFSTILRDLLDRVYVEQTRENISTISTILRKNFSEDILAKAMYHDTENDTHKIVIVDGVRRLADIAYLRELPHFKLVYIEASMENRYERIVKRAENTDDAAKTFEQFKKDHELETELQIRDLKNYSNYVVNNDGTYADLYDQVNKIIAENIA
ncbi:MAG: AAA family ATPase [Candidatus Moranbacteria bacterium]|nr:AAA family ATPase [Candidatus Moranbacteria bacterium]